jgi:hypothetical protein
MTGSFTSLPVRLAGLLTAAAISFGSLSGCASAGTPSCTNAPVFLLDNTTATTITPGAPREWDDRNGVVLSARPVPADIGDSSWANFAPVSGATSFVMFLAAPGAEHTPNSWRLWGDVAPIDAGVQLPAAWPGNFDHGDGAPVKASGGTYSMGIAYLDGSSLDSAQVIAAYLTTVTITAGTGQWTFSDAPTCAPGAASDRPAHP